jgi:S1-C subfamily serine protease
VKEVNRAVLQQLSRIKAPDCPPVRALGDFLEGTGTAEERQALETHLRACPSCLNQLIDLQELAFLEKRGEEPSRQLVEAVKGLVPSAETRREARPSFVQRMATALSTAWQTLLEWSAPRFVGEVVAAVAVAVFLVFIGTQTLRQQLPQPQEVAVSLEGRQTLQARPSTQTAKARLEVSLSEGETIKPVSALSSPEQKLLISLSQVSAEAPSWWQQIATTLGKIPAAPEMEKARGPRNIEVYKKAVSATVLIETDTGSLGSGAIISAQGEVLTNWHVIEGARRITVYFKPEEGVQAREDLAFSATLIKADPIADLALLQIQSPPTELRTLALGELKGLEVGQDVHAIGHPKGQTWTYTTGIISAIRSDYQWKDESRIHQGTVIQTQTPINPGNSGGPLLNDQAELIGINSFVAREAEGLNYAVAVDTITAFLRKPASPPASPTPQPGIRPSPGPAPSPTPVPGPGAPAYRMEPFGQHIVGVYITARVPPPDVWLVYRDPSGQHLAYAAKGSKTPTRIDTIVVGADPQWQVLVYHFDTDCDGVIDLLGYDMEGDGTIERYNPPPQPQRLANLARELVSALQDGTIPYSQVQACS